MNLNEFSLDHVAISISNLERSIDFYTNIFGFSCERIIEMPDGNGRIALLHKKGFTIEMFQMVDVLPLPDDSKVPTLITPRLLKFSENLG